MRPIHLALPLALVVSACTPVSLLERQISVTAEQFRDLPVPAGFRLADRHHQSHSLSLGDYRYGSFLYTGREPVAGVVAYLLERMPQHAWALTEREGTPEAQRLVFQRDDYTADFRIDRVESVTHLHVDVRTNAPPLAQR